MADFHITYHGSVATLDILSEGVREWIEENVAYEPWQWLGRRSLAIEPRMIETIHTALAEAGFTGE